MRASPRRLLGLMRKEFLQIRRDPSALAIAFVLPALLLLVFGYGVSLDARHVPIALVVPSPDAFTTSFTGQLYGSPYFEPRSFRSIQRAERALAARQVQGVVWLQSDFTRRAESVGDAPIGVFVDGVDANTARIIEGYLRQVWANWLASLARSRGQPPTLVLAEQPRMRFNAEVSSHDYLVPGLIAVIMTLTGALLTALVIAREWERGTMEALMVTPVRVTEILLAKLAPYFALGMGGMLVSVGLAVFLFGVPLHGSFLVLTGCSALFMLAALGMGLLISSAAHTQFAAGQIAIVTTFLPAFILSGFVFDIHSMPLAIRLITHLVAARYFVTLLQSQFLAGDIRPVIVPNATALALMAVVFLTLARTRARKRLD